MISPKEEFFELMIEDCKGNGFSALTSKIMSILYLDPNEISLEELAKRTGYSLSAISTEIKFVERMGLIKRLKKPKTKKVFFYMEKDFTAMSVQYMRKKYQLMLKTKDTLPKIIDGYKIHKLDSKEQKQIDIIKNYQKQILRFEKMFRTLMSLFEKLKIIK